MFEVMRNAEGITQGVRRLADGVLIPRDLGNRDWRAFLEWNGAQPVPLTLEDQPVSRQRPRTLQEVADWLRANRSPAQLEALQAEAVAAAYLLSPELAAAHGVPLTDTVVLV